MAMLNPFLFSPGNSAARLANSGSNPIDSIESVKIQKRISHFALVMALETFFLMVVGSATRVMNAGLSCPDWPLCYGEILPLAQMNLQVFLEWFHRLMASLMGLSSLILLGLSWQYRQILPHWFAKAALFAVCLIGFQGILGGLTVTELLRFDIVTAHLGTALFFFVTVLSMGLLLLPYPTQGSTGSNQSSRSKLPHRLFWLGLGSSFLVYAQSILGALVGSQWALHQCFAAQELCVVMNSHLLGVLPTTVATLTLVGWTIFAPLLPPILRKLGLSIGGFLGLQLLLGGLTYQFRLQVELLTIAHQATGAALLGSLVIFTIFAFRIGYPSLKQV
jgi:cytochrome c oxidase assembly protein subunit 15